MLIRSQNLIHHMIRKTMNILHHEAGATYVLCLKAGAHVFELTQREMCFSVSIRALS